MNKKVKTTLLVLLAALVVIQFFQIDKNNPESDPAKDFSALENPPQDVAKLLKSACYDCHSHETVYPWYTNFQPVGWWIKGHIKGARQHLNFATWGDLEAKKKAKKMDEMVDETEGGDMPLKSYTWMHAEAKLTDAQRHTLVDWFKAKESRKSENIQLEGGEENQLEGAN
ncbi:MAG: heme-binding domain-containing protein [Saprospiraceae bacterium]